MNRIMHIEIAHRDPAATSTERRLHGHRLGIDAEWHAHPIVPSRSALDAVFANFVGRFDGHTLLWFEDRLYRYLCEEENAGVGWGGEYGVLGMKFVPTLPNLAAYFVDTLNRQGLVMDSVMVWTHDEDAVSARPMLGPPLPERPEAGVRFSHAQRA